MILIGGKWEDVYLLPPLAFKLWMYYYRLEGKNREGCASRLAIARALDMNKDAVSRWRDYLIEHEWIEVVGYKAVSGDGKPIPIMRVRHGKIVPVTRTNKGWANVVKTGGTSHKVKTGTPVITPDRPTSHNPDRAASHKGDRPTSHIVDKSVNKPSVDGDQAQFLGAVEVEGLNLFRAMIHRFRDRLATGEDGHLHTVKKPVPIQFEDQHEAIRFVERIAKDIPPEEMRGYRTVITHPQGIPITVELVKVPVCDYGDGTCENDVSPKGPEGRCVEHFNAAPPCVCCNHSPSVPPSSFCKSCDDGEGTCCEVFAKKIKAKTGGKR